MKPETLIDILDCGHMTKYVSGPFDQRGGIMIVAPPSSLKTTLIELALEEYPNAMILSDLNINSLMKMRDDLVSNRFATMAFPEFSKLYERHARTASNIEGTIKLLVEDGFRSPSFADPRAGGLKARMFVIGGITETFYKEHYDSWQKSGFLRRFLFSIFSVENPEKITDAIKEWRKLDFSGIKRRRAGGNPINMDVDPKESAFLHKAVAEQGDDKTPLVVLMKIFRILKWKYEKEPGRARKIMEDFIPTLKRDGGSLTL